MKSYLLEKLQKWRSLPQKSKLAVAIVFNIIGVILLFGVYKSIGFDIWKSLIPSKRVSQLVDNDKWEKLQIPERETPFFVLSAKTEKKYGVSPKEVFELTTKEPISQEFLNENIDSSTQLSIKKISNNTYQFSPQVPLDFDQELRIRLNTLNKQMGGHTFDRSYSWAFQTQSKFKVVSTIPGDSRTNVPLQAGIEFVFNNEDYEDVKSHLLIEPSIDYRTERRGETISIIPTKPLDPETSYTVTLRKTLNLTTINDPLGIDTKFTFKTQPEPKPIQSLNIDESFVQVATNETAEIKVFRTNWNTSKPIKTEIYKIPSTATFINTYINKKVIDTSKLLKVATAELTVKSKENIDYIQLPGSLESGLYLTKFLIEDGKEPLYAWVQSTNIAGFVSVGRNQTVVWANSIDNGPAGSALINLLGTNRTASTNDQGWATFSTPGQYFTNNKNFIEIAKEDENVILQIDSLEYRNSQTEIDVNDYWSYIYHERQIYKPDDTVYYWGILKNRDTNTVPAGAQVKLTNYYYGSGDFELKAPISGSADGSFIGNFKLQNVPPGWYYLIISVGDVEVARSGLKVFEYKKPEMKIEVTANKKAIFAGEKADFSAQISFFDGTPGSNTDINLFESFKQGNKKLTTDRNGNLKYNYASEYKEGNYYPQYETVTFSPALAGEAKIEGYGSVFVYGSKIMIETENSQDQGRAKLKAKLSNIDLDSYNNGTSLDVKGSPTRNQKVKLSTEKTWYERKETGTYYDFVEKVSKPTYHYERHIEKVEEKELETNDVGEIVYEFDLEKDKSYSVDITTYDDGNRKASKQEYFYYYNYQENELESLPSLNLNKKINEYSIGEEVKLTIQKEGQPYKDTDSNRFMFILANRGQQDVFTKDSPEMSFEFGNSHMPNIYAGAIAFSGKNYLIINAPCRQNWYCPNYDYYTENGFQGAEIRYKKTDSELKLTLKPDSEKYAPGDISQMEVVVTKGDKPVEGATVQLTLVDEALAALGAVNKPSPLITLYKSVSSLIYYNYYSHKGLLPTPPSAEKGGGGGDRELFKDTAYFESAKTDSTGSARFNIKLPDNITSWLIYAQAINANMDTGHTEASTIVTKGFFVTNHFPSNILSRDKAFISANAFGTVLKEGNKILYESVINKGEIEITKNSQTGDAFKDAIMPFPTLSEGTYKLTTRGKFAELSDGVTLPLTVNSTRLDFEYAKTVSLSSGQISEKFDEIESMPEKGVKIVVSDKGKGQFYQRLNNYCYNHSNRVEKRIAQLAASKILIDKFDSKDCISKTQDFTLFQYSDGGLAQTSWGGSNLETTLWATFIDPSVFNKDKLINYFEHKFETATKSEEKIYSAWGLTLLGKPKILDLNVRADSAGTYKEKVLSGIALASVGNNEKALEIFYNLLADYAYTNKPYIRIQSGQENMDSYLNDTSLALLLGSLVLKDYDSGMNLYLRDYRTYAQDIVLDIADIAYINEEILKLPDEDTTVLLNYRNQQLTKDLSKGKNFVIKLSANEIETFSAKVLSGQVEITTNYFLTPKSFESLPTDKRLSINRSYKKVKGEGEDFKPGDIIEITINYDIDRDNAPLGSYYIIDHLPSGLTYLENPYYYGLRIPTYSGYMYEIKPNVIQGYASNSPWWYMYSNKQYIYYARVSGVGTYVAEPAFVQAQIDKSIFNRTSEATIEIKNN